VEKGQSVIEEEECLEPAASFKETVIMGLRMTQGVSRAQLRSRYGRDVETEYGAILQRLVSQELLELSETHLRLSARGRRFANQVMAELV
jgi:oxygen-independent coproporphyrinogen-3 oxidase